MTGYPSKTLPRDITGAIATAFSDGNGPTATKLMSAIDLAGIDRRRMPDTNKEARVQWAFDHAHGDQAYQLVEELLLLMRHDGTFTNRMPSYRQWVARTQVAFTRVGYSLDSNGYVDWQVGGNDAGRDAQPKLSDGQASTTPAVPFTGEQAMGGSPSGDNTMKNIPAPFASQLAVERKEIFLVHGHDEAARNEVEVFITRTTGITPIVLMLEPSSGLTVIEKFEKHADRSGYAVVLMTNDDLGNAKADAEKGVLNPRPRQNVVFEFGYFVGAIRRAHVAALVGNDVEKPSDIAGLVYVPYGPGTDWREILRGEMRAAGIPIL